MKRGAAGAHLQAPCFLSLRSARAIEPTIAWTIVSFRNANTFLQLSGLGRALQPRLGANSDLGPMSFPGEPGHQAMPINFLV